MGLHMIQVKSEVGVLKRVLLHRPSKELEQLTPDALESLLFDDIPYLHRAQQEHNSFAQILRDNGVEVVYLEELATETLDVDATLREQFVAELLGCSGSMLPSLHGALKEYLLGLWDTRTLVRKAMTGVYFNEIPDHTEGSLAQFVREDRRFALTPMPNLYFTRDPFAVIGNGKKRYSEIEDKLDVKKTGNLAKQMKPLRDLEIISRNYPINKLNDSKKSTFEINDNLLRFYFTFIYKNASALQVLGAEAFYDEYVAPTLTDFISRRFEGICRDYFSLQVRSGKLKGVRNIGSYYYDDPVHRKNGEFDVALELADGYAIYEAKYYAQPMTLDEIHREAQQVANIKELAVKQLGFIAINGFVEQEKPYTYLDGNDIFAGM